MTNRTMTGALPKKLGVRQLAILGYLDRHGTTDLDTLAAVIFGNVYRRPDVRKACIKLEARGLVVIERDEKGEAISVAQAAGS